MNRLPYDEELNIGYLSRLFDDTSNCYKFFWFQAVLNKLTEDKNRFTYDELINEMIVDASFIDFAFRSVIDEIMPDKVVIQIFRRHALKFRHKPY